MTMTMTRGIVSMLIAGFAISAAGQTRRSNLTGGWDGGFWGGSSFKITLRDGAVKDEIDEKDENEDFKYAGPREAVAFSPDGHWVAVANRRKGLGVWDVATGRLRFTSSDTSEVSSLVFHPNSRWLATTAQDNKTIKIWDVVSGKEVQSLTGHSSEVYAAAFTRDGTLVSVSRDGALKFWDLSTGRRTREIQVLPMQRAVFSFDGTLLATRRPQNPLPGHDRRQEIQLFSVRDLRVIRVMPAGFDGGAMNFSRDNALLAEGDHEWNFQSKTHWGEIKIYNVAGGGEPRRIPVTDSYFQPASLAFSPNSRWLAVGGDKGEAGGNVDLWDVESGQQVFHLEHPSIGDKVAAFSPDGEWLAYTNKDYVNDAPGQPVAEIKTVELRKVALRRELPGGRSELSILEGEANLIESLAIAGNGSKLVSTAIDGTLRIWNTSNGQLSHLIKPAGRIVTTQSALSADGKLLAAILAFQRDDRKNGETDHIAKIWDVETGAELHSFDVAEGKPGLARVMFSPDGRWLALGGFCKVILLDAATGHERRTLVISPDPIEKLRKENALSDIALLGYVVTNMSFSPDGKRLAAVSFEPHALQLWDTGSGKKLNEITADPQTEQPRLEAEHFGPMHFSPDGRSLMALKTKASGEDPMATRVATYESAALREIRSFVTTGLFFGFSSAADGGLLMSSRDGEIDMVDPLTGRVKRTIGVDLSHSTRALTVSSDGKWLAAADDAEAGSSIHLWDLTTGRITTIGGFALRQLNWEEKSGLPLERTPSKTEAGVVQDNHDDRVVKDPRVVNWDPPAKRELVQRALSDEITDPARIVEWAKNYNVTMTTEEVLRFKSELTGKLPKGYELYSWLENGTAVYSLVPGTNRNKSLDEIMQAPRGERFETVSALKKKIASLPKGEQIIWSNAIVNAKDRSRLAYPDMKTVKDLEEMAKQSSIELTVPNSGK